MKNFLYTKERERERDKKITRINKTDKSMM